MWGNVPASAKSKEQQPQELCGYFISRKVSGVFFAPVELTEHKDQVNIRLAHELERAGILGAGCRRLAFVSRPGSAPTIQMRIAGYREALWRRGVAPEPELIVQMDPADVEHFKRFVRGQSPDGIVCGNDFTAGQLMHSAITAGLQIPRDLKMAGFDDVKYAKVLPVPLTTVQQPCSEIGAEATISASGFLLRFGRRILPLIFATVELRSSVLISLEAASAFAATSVLPSAR